MGSGFIILDSANPCMHVHTDAACTPVFRLGHLACLLIPINYRNTRQLIQRLHLYGMKSRQDFRYLGSSPLI